MNNELFACGYYIVEWFNSNNEVVKSERKYLTSQLYRREYMDMQTAYLRGQDLAGLRIKPCED